jgi:hypothetical protein
LLSFADQVNQSTVPQDDSALLLRQSEFLETIHFEQMEMQPLSQYVANEQSNMLDDEMMTYNNDNASQTESELEDEEANTLGLLKKVDFFMT